MLIAPPVYEEGSWTRSVPSTSSAVLSSLRFFTLAPASITNIISNTAVTRLRSMPSRMQTVSRRSSIPSSHDGLEKAILSAAIWYVLRYARSRTGQATDDRWSSVLAASSVSGSDTGRPPMVRPGREGRVSCASPASAMLPGKATRLMASYTSNLVVGHSSSSSSFSVSSSSFFSFAAPSVILLLLLEEDWARIPTSPLVSMSYNSRPASTSASLSSPAFASRAAGTSLPSSSSSLPPSLLPE